MAHTAICSDVKRVSRRNRAANQNPYNLSKYVPHFAAYGFRALSKIIKLCSSHAGRYRMISIKLGIVPRTGSSQVLFGLNAAVPGIPSGGLHIPAEVEAIHQRSKRNIGSTNWFLSPFSRFRRVIWLPAEYKTTRTLVMSHRDP